MEVLLVNPPQPELRQPRAYIPLGLAYIGAVLERSNIPVKIWNVADRRVGEIRKIPHADIYGITCVTAAYRSVVQLSRKIKERGGRVVLGGIHASIMPEQTLKDSSCDHVITGEAEFAFRDLVLGEIRSPIFNAGIIKELDELPMPARHLFNGRDVVDFTEIHGRTYDRSRRGATTICTSRGCPYNCAFCCKNPFTKTVRLHSPRRVVEEFKQVVKDYGIAHFRIVDDMFTVNRERVEEICRLIKVEDLTIYWTCITRSDHVDKNLLHVMYEAGCRQIDFGIESGSQRILNLMRKGTTVERNEEAVKAAKEEGIRVKVFLMHGFPSETKRDLEKTVDFVKRVKPHAFTLSKFQPLPGSHIWSHPEKYGLNALEKGSYFYPDSDEEHRKLKETLEGCGEWS